MIGTSVFRKPQGNMNTMEQTGEMMFRGTTSYKQDWRAQTEKFQERDPVSKKQE